MPKHKLLLADDSITIQKVVNLTFADEGIEVISVGDGNSAMDKLREDTPDLVLADVNMPGLNGYEICEKIKAANQNTPVILLVGSFEPFDEDEAKRVGADAYLTKPFQSISELVSKVNELLSLDNEDSATIEDFADDEYESNESRNFGGFDDAAIDDEMIQTDQIGSIPTDEITKFETQTIEYENAASSEDTSDIYELTEKSYQYDQNSAAPKNESENEIFQPKQDLIEIQELDAQFLQNDLENNQTYEPAELPMPENAPTFELDDMDLLDLPPLDFPADGKFQEPEESELFGDTFSENAVGEKANSDEISDGQSLTNESVGDNVSPYTSTKTFEETEFNTFETVDFEDTTETEKSVKDDADFAENEISSEMIEAIAQRVVEKLSEKVVREVAKKVVPQLADLIIKKMAEEKLKN